MKRISFLLIVSLVCTSAFSQFATRSGKINENQTSKKNYIISKQKDVIFSDDFESATLAGWGNIDQDGDGNLWAVGNSADQAHGGVCFAMSESWSQTGGGALNPVNWLISPAIDLTAESGTIFLDYYVGPRDQDWPAEHYKLLVSTTGTATADFTTNLYEETIGVGSENGFTKRSINLSAYVGQTIYLTWIHFDCSDNFQLMLDDVSVYENTSSDAGITAISAPNNETSCALTNAEDVTISFFNFGGQAITNLSVAYSINGGELVSETITTLNIAPGTSGDYTFNTKADLSTLGYYTLEASVILDNDSNEANNTMNHKVTNGDAKITINTLSDSNNDEQWVIKNSAGETIATGPDYQWDVENTVDVCVIANDCYTFDFTGFDATGWLEILYNGVVVGGGQTAGNTVGGVSYFGIGDNCTSDEIKLTKITVPATAPINTDIDVSGTVLNKGSENLTAFDVTYNLDGGTDVATYSISGINIATGGTYDFTHNIALNFASAATYTVNVTVSNPNGNTDDVSDNTASTDIMVYEAGCVRNVLVEEFSTEKCPNCPPVATYLGGIAQNNENVIMMVHHAGYGTDAYTIPENTEMLAFFNSTTFAPAGMMDRHYNGLDNDDYQGNDPGPVFWPGSPFGATKINDRLAQPAFVDVNFDGNYNEETKIITVTISGTFMAEFTDDLGVSLWIIEDGITSTTQAGFPGEWTHHAVVRDAISGAFGDAITTSTNTDDVYTATFTYTVNDSWVFENLSLVAFVNTIDAGDVNNRTVHNAGTIELSTLPVGVTDNKLEEANLFPNPVKDELTITGLDNVSKIIVSNVLGQTIKTVNVENLTKSTISTTELENGIYMITIVDKLNNTRTVRVVKQ
ncbi:MAG: choice-of-anchor J domain-containing protein [Salinivirgaceae bacterium]|nr:choice-of-anchor J domain-containing protein [Salinivirgaceae bacterium]